MVSLWSACCMWMYVCIMWFNNRSDIQITISSANKLSLMYMELIALTRSCMYIINNCGADTPLSQTTKFLVAFVIDVPAETCDDSYG